MRGTGHADVLIILQGPGNKTDAVPCECLPAEKCAALLLRDGQIILPVVDDNPKTLGIITVDERVDVIEPVV